MALIEKIQELLVQKMSYAKIAKALGITEYKVMAELGVINRKGPKKKRDPRPMCERCGKYEKKEGNRKFCVFCWSHAETNIFDEFGLIE
jgi:hypothetical protein